LNLAKSRFRRIFLADDKQPVMQLNDPMRLAERGLASR
jgi:hypothetical protein